MTRNNLTFKGAFIASADGTFTGEASTFGNVDAVGDRVMRTAFTKDLTERGPRRPLLWNHSHTDPIGSVELEETARGLRVTKGTLVLDVQRAREIYALMKAGVIDAMSIGYETVTSRKARDGARELTEVKLWEVSLVTFPANTLALVDSVKSDEATLSKLLSALRSANFAIKTARDRDNVLRLRTTLANLKILRLKMMAESIGRRLEGR